VERMEGKRLHGHVRGDRSRGRQRKRRLGGERHSINYLQHMENPRIEKSGEA